MVRCYELLDATSRSFAAVIQALDPELRPAICIFYLVLRGLDTVEDDMSIDLGYAASSGGLPGRLSLVLWGSSWAPLPRPLGVFLGASPSSSGGLHGRRPSQRHGVSHGESFVPCFYLMQREGPASERLSQQDGGEGLDVLRVCATLRLSSLLRCPPKNSMP